jgi:hypothetical protein
MHAVAKTAFFFTNSARKGAHAFDKFIRFVWLDHNLYLKYKQLIWEDEKVEKIRTGRCGLRGASWGDLERGKLGD